ncbi:hypothetical protein [Amycolatopsis sp. A1MSW2902]|uniref:hypothetical protein n=1 Tax=Amycolatopsis sp. A1MSW2902 TaxID=687413 RepID=UPI00307EFF52
MLQAFLDESFHEHCDAGFYILAAAVLPEERHEVLREAMLALRGTRRGSKLHWYPMDDAEKLSAAKHVADIAEMQVVTVTAPVPVKGQERARALGLQRLVAELHSAGVRLIVAESRQRDLNTRDIQTVQRIRRIALPKGADIRIEHRLGDAEPLLWISDVVAGAVRARLTGTSRYFASLAECVIELQVDGAP